MLILKDEQQQQRWQWVDWLEESNMFTSPPKYLGLTLQANRNVTHPLARFSIPQYSSTSCLQGLETLLQPTSSDMSPQSSSPLHCRVRGIQRPEGNDVGRHSLTHDRIYNLTWRKIKSYWEVESTGWMLNMSLQRAADEREDERQGESGGFCRMAKSSGSYCACWGHQTKAKRQQVVILQGLYERLFLVWSHQQDLHKPIWTEESQVFPCNMLN